MNFRRAFFFGQSYPLLFFFLGGRSSEYIPSVCMMMMKMKMKMKMKMMMMMKMKLLQMEVSQQKPFPVSYETTAS